MAGALAYYIGQGSGKAKPGRPELWPELWPHRGWNGGAFARGAEGGYFAAMPFSTHREAQARKCGAKAATFASVIRPETHPERPERHVPLDGFRNKRGYAPMPGLVTEPAWKEHGEAEENSRPMRYWLRAFPA